MKIMDESLARDLLNFEEQNNKLTSQDGFDENIAGVSAHALDIARRNIEPLSIYVGEQVRRVGLTFSSPEVAYSYQSPEDVANAFKMALTRAVDPGMARNSAMIALNLMLGSLGRPSSFGSEEERTAATVALASSVDKHRQDLVEGSRFFLDALTRHTERRFRRRQNMLRLLGVLLLLLVLWFFLGR